MAKSTIEIRDINTVIINGKRVGTLMDAVHNYHDLLEEIRDAAEQWDASRLEGMISADQWRDAMAEFQQAKEAHRDDIAQIVKSHDAQIAQLNKQHKESMQALAVNHKDTVNDLKEQISALGTTTQARKIQRQQEQERLEQLAHDTQLKLQQIKKEK